jgi:hypothetical protein
MAQRSPFKQYIKLSVKIRLKMNRN